jgi:hypothetical protein
MYTLILVLVLMFVAAAALMAVAFYRGAFRLASTSTEKVQFVLMRKKDPNLVDAKIATEIAKPLAAKPLSPNDESH